MKIKFRDAGQRGYFVQAPDAEGRLREYGAVDQRGGLWSKPVWVITEVRGRPRSKHEQFFKTRKAAAEALIKEVVL